jgi:2-iminobutanoate/2-iminopropanoate deaminase
MPAIEAIRSEQLPPPVGPFSPAIRYGGFIFFSGQIGVDPARGGALVGGGIEDETRQLFANISTLLDAAGKSFSDVVKVNVFLTDMADFAALNAIYAAQFDAPFPARTTVAVAALPLGASIEIEMVVKD